jgi:transcriptional regulator with XRE-family HTH domain
MKIRFANFTMLNKAVNMEYRETRERLGEQLAAARREREWRLRDLAYRTANTSARLSVVENGKANPTIDTLAQLGEAVGMSLVFVPKDKLAQAMAMSDPTQAGHVPVEVPSVYDELFIPDPLGEEEDTPIARP